MKVEMVGEGHTHSESSESESDSDLESEPELMSITASPASFAASEL